MKGLFPTSCPTHVLPTSKRFLCARARARSGCSVCAMVDCSLFEENALWLVSRYLFSPFTREHEVMGANGNTSGWCESLRCSSGTLSFFFLSTGKQPSVSAHARTTLLRKERKGRFPKHRHLHSRKKVYLLPQVQEEGASEEDLVESLSSSEKTIVWLIVGENKR